MKKNLTNPLYYQLVMIVITFITSCTYLRVRVGKVSYVGLLIGFIICIASLFDGSFKKVIIQKTNWLLFAFCGSYLVTIVLSRQSQFVVNIKQWVYMCLFMYLLTAANNIYTRKEKIRNFKKISYCYCVISFIVALISFYMFIVEFRYCAQDPSTNLWYELGMVDRRLAGLYNSNTSASIFAISIIISIFLFFDSNKVSVSNFTWKKAFCIVNALLQFVCLILTSSRGAICSFYVSIFIVSFLLMRSVYMKENRIKKYFEITIVSLLVVVAIFGVGRVLRMGLEYVPGLIIDQRETASIISGSIELNVEKVDLEREYDTITSGRAAIWKSAICIIKDNTLFGIPYESLKELASGYFEVNDVSTNYLNAGGTFHNIAISCLVSSGIIGFILIITFVFIRLFDSIRFVFYDKNHQIIEILPLIIVIMLLINEMVESRILYSVNILNVIFWIGMGYLPSLKRVKNET